MAHSGEKRRMVANTETKPSDHDMTTLYNNAFLISRLVTAPQPPITNPMHSIGPNGEPHIKGHSPRIKEKDQGKRQGLG